MRLRTVEKTKVTKEGEDASPRQVDWLIWVLKQMEDGINL